MRELNLKRPLVIFDLETTGSNPTVDRIVEISLIKHNPGGTVVERSHLVNPGIPISPGATAIHGITNEDVDGEPTFQNLSIDLLFYLEGCDLAGFNAIRFDIPLLQNEFNRCDLTFNLADRYVIDPMVIFYAKEPRDLSAAYAKYCGRKLEGAHNSLIDARAAQEIILGQTKHYSDIGQTVEEVHKFCHPTNPDWIDETGRLIRTPAGVVFGFGKYNSKLLSEIAKIDSDYLEWILSQDFDHLVKDTIKEAIDFGT